MQTIQRSQQSEEELKRKKKESRFDNFFMDALYNIITYIPVMVISWVATSLDFDK